MFHHFHESGASDTVNVYLISLFWTLKLTVQYQDFDYLGNFKGESIQLPGSLKNTDEHSSELVFVNDAPYISLESGSPPISGFSGVELAWSCPWPSRGAFHPCYSLTSRSPAPSGNPHEDHFQGISLSSWRRFPSLNGTTRAAL